MKTNLLKKLLIGTALLSSLPAWADTHLLGKVFLSQPLAGATVRIYDPGHRLVETIPHATSENGIIESHLSVDLPDFIVEATDGTLDGVPFHGTLRANVTDHDTAVPAPVFVNAATTLASVYHDAHPELRPAQVEDQVRQYLGIPRTMSLGSDIDSEQNYFSQARFMTEATTSRTGFDAYVFELSREIGSRSRSFEGLPQANGPTEDIMMSLAKGAASKVGGEAAGWVMNMLLGSSSKDKTAEELAEIKNELTKHTQMLNAISSKLDALSSQLNQAIERVIDEVKQTGYEGRAQQLDAPMSKIKAVFDTLVLYTQADPKVDRTHEIEKLRDYIKIEIVAALFQIHDSLVGTPTVTGLIPTWGGINAKKVLGFPTFLTNDYLRPVNLQADYYRTWEIIAGTLIIEAYHAEHTTPDPTVGKHYYDLLKSKLDDQRKFVPGAELGDDNTLVDTRSKLMWLRSMTLEPFTKTVEWYFPYAVNYVRGLRIGGYTNWKIPTGEQWESLAKGMASPRVSNGMNARGFKGIQDTYALLQGNCVFNMYTEKAQCGLNPVTSVAAPFTVRAWTPWP